MSSVNLSSKLCLNRNHYKNWLTNLIVICLHKYYMYGYMCSITFNVLLCIINFYDSYVEVSMIITVNVDVGL